MFWLHLYWQRSLNLSTHRWRYWRDAENTLDGLWQCEVPRDYLMLALDSCQLIGLNVCALTSLHKTDALVSCASVVWCILRSSSQNVCTWFQKGWLQKGWLRHTIDLLLGLTGLVKAYFWYRDSVYFLDNYIKQNLLKKKNSILNLHGILPIQLYCQVLLTNMEKKKPNLHTYLS